MRAKFTHISFLKTIVCIVLLLSLAPAALADEGMWMVNTIDKALAKQMKQRGLKLAPREIYNADAPGATLSDAIVSLEFYGTASLVSPEGLIITNHHCAFSDIAAISTADHNYLEDGFWAYSRQEELPIPNKKVYILKRVLDVTGEVEALKAGLDAKGERYGSRKLSHLMETKYEKETGLEASLESMWAGEKYYISLYQTYTDIRLVAAPPVSIAAFGGDEDNWEWPQHKCDFALYRIYDHGEPLVSEKWLKISTKGVQEGDFTMVLGFPGRTDRYSSAAKTAHVIELQRTVTNDIRKEQMEIVRKAMDADPEVRLKYADWFFMLSNVQELQEGEVQCVDRFRVIDEKRAEERELQAWIDADSDRKARWGTLLSDLEAEYAATDAIEQQKSWYRETLIRGTRIAPTMLRMSNNRTGDKEEIYRRGLSEVDPAVEKALLALAAEKYFENVSPAFTGEHQKALRSEFTNAAGSTDYPALAAWLWEHPDEMVDFYSEVKITAFNDAEQHVASITDLHHEYIHALYAMRSEKGLMQYPDANSTLRLTYGRVSALSPCDGVVCSWQSTSQGLLEKNNPAQHDFALPDAFVQTVAGAPRFPVNFLTDNDITGGNSGSPVLNARGEVVGLAFDGNKESLASNFSATEGYNKCVCVDIRYVLRTLKEYAHLDRILEEMGIR